MLAIFGREQMKRTRGIDLDLTPASNIAIKPSQRPWQIQYELVFMCVLLKLQFDLWLIYCPASTNLPTIKLQS